MPYSAIDIANYFVDRAIADRKGLTPMQVVKLTFLAHGWYLGINKKPLLNEPIQAWRYGPVVPSVYFAFQGFGKEVIDKKAPQFFFLTDHPKIDEADKAFLGDVYDTYSKYSGGELSTLTHKSGSPWAQAVARFAGQELPHFLVIEEAIIQDYYCKKADENRRRQVNP